MINPTVTLAFIVTVGLTLFALIKIESITGKYKDPIMQNIVQLLIMNQLMLISRYLGEILEQTSLSIIYILTLILSDSLTTIIILLFYFLVRTVLARPSDGFGVLTLLFLSAFISITSIVFAVFSLQGNQDLITRTDSVISIGFASNFALFLIFTFRDYQKYKKQVINDSVFLPDTIRSISFILGLALGTIVLNLFLALDVLLVILLIECLVLTVLARNISSVKNFILLHPRDYFSIMVLNRFGILKYEWDLISDHDRPHNFLLSSWIVAYQELLSAYFDAKIDIQKLIFEKFNIYLYGMEDLFIILVTDLENKILERSLIDFTKKLKSYTELQTGSQVPNLEPLINDVFYYVKRS